MDHLWTPWRMDYLKDNSKPDGCIFCEALAAGDDRGRLIVHRGLKTFVILNRYPYNNGHLMIVPYEHTPSLESLDVPTVTEMVTLAQRGLRVLQSLYQPQAYNIGINIGRAAGAGVAEHVHMHLLPRWQGDTNFMTAVANTRVIPETLDDTWANLRAAWGESP